MATVTLKNVAAGPITNGLNLTIADREFVVLTGPPGSGSSTVVRVIAGLEELASGEIFFDDRRVDNTAPKDRDAAWVAGDYTPYPRLSVFENLAIGLRGKNFGETEVEKRIDAVAGALGLERHLESNAQTLSLAQRRLLGIARGMVRQPRVYLFADPLIGLGPEAARDVRAQIAKLRQRSSATIIYAAGTPAEALALGHRTVVIADGVIQQEGPAREIFRAPTNLRVAAFFGDPPMNLVRGTVKQDRNGLVFAESGDGTISMTLSDRHPEAPDFIGKPVVLGFRPEDMETQGANRPEGSRPGFRALVERIEGRGSAADLYLQTGAHSLIASGLRTADEVEAGQRMVFVVRPGTSHLFDPESGRRLTR